MSPSRRRAIGAVRGLASRALWYGAAALPRMGVTGRRALRGPGAPAGGRGRTETPPSKTLSVCYRHYAHALPGPRGTRINHAIFARALPGRITRAARWGHRALPPLHPWGAPPLRTRKIRTRITRAHYARPRVTRTARGGSPPSRLAPYRHAARVVPVAKHPKKRARAERELFLQRDYENR